MRATEQEGTGTSALSYVRGDFERIGWGPIENPSHDLGTDLFIQVRDERRFALGLVIGAQVKGGPSWFKDPQHNSEGALEGWWFYEPTADHFDDWVRYGLPHLVVLYDFESRTSYWVHVTADRCIVTGKGCKILVPNGQVVDTTHLDRLLEVAISQRAASAFEQKVFGASAGSAPPGRRIRYAMLTPRLIAPHGNVGFGVPPEPEEYLALLARRRSTQIAGYRKKYPELLDASKADERTDWRWRFAYAFQQWLEDDETASIESLLDSAPSASHRTAVAAVLAAAYLESGTYDKSSCMLDRLIEKDDLPPVDLAWLLVHRATLRAELGDIPDARSDAASATKALRGDEDDPTATMLAGVAANILFVTAGFGSGDLENVINSNDTAPAWWRGQTLSWALGHLDDEAFEDWLNDDKLRFNASDDGWENLESIRLNASLASDHEVWRSIATRQGKFLLRGAHHIGDDLRLLQGLDQLRRAGSKDALSSAMRVVWETGPVSVIREVAELASPQGITRSTAAATVSAWGAAADALSDDYASQLASWCLNIISSREALTSFSNRFGATFRVDNAAVDALATLVPVASQAVRIEAARFVMRIQEQWVLSQQWARVVLNLDADSFRAVGVEPLRSKAEKIQDHVLKDALLRQLALCGDVAARNMLVERASSDVLALEFIPGRTSFDEALASRLISTLEVKLAQIREAASRNSYGFGSVDVAETIVRLNVLHPTAAAWDSTFEFLADPRVAEEHKEKAVAILGASFTTLGVEIQRRLEEVLPALLSTRFVWPKAGQRFRWASARLQILLITSNEEQEHAVAALLTGAASQRRLATNLLGMGVAPGLCPSLHALVSDDDREVRVGAAFALGRISRQHEEGVWMPSIARIVGDRGAAAPIAFLEGISEKAFQGFPGVLDASEILKEHASHQVRRLANEFFAELHKPR